MFTATSFRGCAKENQYVVVFTDSLSNLTEEISTEHITTTSVACKLLRDWNILYGLLIYVFTDNGINFAASFSPHAVYTLV